LIVAALAIEVPEQLVKPGRARRPLVSMRSTAAVAAAVGVAAAAEPAPAFPDAGMAESARVLGPEVCIGTKSLDVPGVSSVAPTARKAPSRRLATNPCSKPLPPAPPLPLPPLPVLRVPALTVATALDARVALVQRVVVVDPPPSHATW